MPAEVAVLGVGMHPWGKWGRNFVEYGVHAARACRRRSDEVMVALATAHPAKFPDAVRRAGIEREPELPTWLADLHQRPERCTVLPRDRAELARFIRARVHA